MAADHTLAFSELGVLPTSVVPALDAMPEQSYADLVLLARTLCTADMALLSLVDGQRIWFKDNRQITGNALQAAMACCWHTVQHPQQVTVVEDLRNDLRFGACSWAMAVPELCFYAGAALVADNDVVVGVLCVLDQQPRHLSEQQQLALSAIARQVMHLLALRRSNETLQSLAADNARMTQQLLEYQQELEEQNAELAKEAQHDPLTGLLNRAGLDNLRAALKKQERRRRQYTIAVIDLDHFKRVNDTHGHAIGDQVLRAVAGEIRRMVRSRDHVGRFGGEEFIVVMPDTPLPDARMVMDRLCATLAASTTLPVPVTVSIGLASNRMGLDDSDVVFRNADQALYLAKNGGRNRVVVLDD